MVYKLSGPSGLLVIHAPWPVLGTDVSETVALSEIWSLVESVKSLFQARLVDLLPWSLWPPPFPRKTSAQMWPALLCLPQKRRPWCLVFRPSPRRPISLYSESMRCTKNYSLSSTKLGRVGQTLCHILTADEYPNKWASVFRARYWEHLIGLTCHRQGLRV